MFFPKTCFTSKCSPRHKKGKFDNPADFFHSKSKLKTKQRCFQKAKFSLQCYSGHPEYRFEKSAECFLFRVQSWYKPNISLRWTTFSSIVSAEYDECSFEVCRKLFTQYPKFFSIVFPKFLFFSRTFPLTSRKFFWQLSQKFVVSGPKTWPYLWKISQKFDNPKKFHSKRYPGHVDYLFDNYADSFSLEIYEKNHFINLPNFTNFFKKSSGQLEHTFDTAAEYTTGYPKVI